MVKRPFGFWLANVSTSTDPRGRRVRTTPVWIQSKHEISLFPDQLRQEVMCPSSIDAATTHPPCHVAQIVRHPCVVVLFHALFQFESMLAVYPTDAQEADVPKVHADCIDGIA